MDSGYDDEAEKLRSEADSRGLKLNESISLSTYAELFKKNREKNEIINSIN